MSLPPAGSRKLTPPRACAQRAQGIEAKLGGSSAALAAHARRGTLFPESERDAVKVPRALGRPRSVLSAGAARTRRAVDGGAVGRSRGVCVRAGGIAQVVGGAKQLTSQGKLAAAALAALGESSGEPSGAGASPPRAALVGALGGWGLPDSFVPTASLARPDDPDAGASGAAAVRGASTTRGAALSGLLGIAEERPASPFHRSPSPPLLPRPPGPSPTTTTTTTPSPLLAGARASA